MPKQRWKKILIITGGSVLGLVLLVLLIAPSIIGAVAKSKIASTLGEMLQADVSVEDVSFSWSGRVAIDGFRIAPRGSGEGRPLLDVKKVNVQLSLGSAMGGKYIADVEVVSPQIFIEKGADGKFNYEFPPAPPKPEKEREKRDGAGEKPFVQATLKVRDGSVVIRGRGRETRYGNLVLDAKVDTLEKPIDYFLSLQGAGTEKVTVGGSFDLEKRAGPATVALEGVSLQNLTGAAQAYSNVAELDGIVTGTLEYRIQGVPQFAGKARLEVADLAVNGNLRLDRIVVTHDGAIDAGGSGRQVIGIHAGKAAGGTITVDVTDAFGTPGATTDIKLDADLAQLGETLRAETKLGGMISLRGTTKSKGFSADADLKMIGSNLAVNTMKIDRIDLHHTGTLDEKGNGKNRITLESGKAVSLTADVDVTDAFGPAPRVQGSFKGSSDLGELAKVVEKLIGLKPDLQLLGAATVSGRVEARGDDVKGEFDLAATDLVAVDKAKRHEIDTSITVTLAGGWNGKTKTATADVLNVNSSFATLKGRGGAALGGDTLEIRESTFTLDADLDKLSGKLKSFMESPPALAGRVTVDGKSVGKRIDLDVKSPAIDATVRGKEELRIDALVRPAELSKWIPGPDLGGPEVTLTALVTLKPKGIAVTARTKLEGLTLDKGYSVKGEVSTEVAYNDSGTTGTTKLVNLEIVDGKKNVVKDPGVTVVHDLAITPTAIEIRKAEIASNFVRGTVTGKILSRDQEPEFQGLHAAFTYVPDKLGAVLAPWLPGKLEGAEEKSLDLRLDGKAKSFDALAILRGGRGTVDVDLARFTMTGISVSGRTKLDLKDGRMTSGTPLDVNKGKTELQASLDFREPFDPAQGRPTPAVRPRSTFEFRAKDVDANANMAPLLEAINPIFHTVNGVVDGQIHSEFKLIWDGKLDPLETDPEKWKAAAAPSLSGSGVLAVKNLNIVGSPAVAEIMAALGEGNQLRGELLGTDVRIAGGRCEYTNMTLRLARYELRFTGWVDFRKHLELMVEMPMTEGMIKKYPGLARYTGKTLFVPLRGKVDSPRLDFQKAISEILKRVAENVLEDKAKQLLEDLLKKKKKDK